MPPHLLACSVTCYLNISCCIYLINSKAKHLRGPVQATPKMARLPLPGVHTLCDSFPEWGWDPVTALMNRLQQKSQNATPECTYKTLWLLSGWHSLKSQRHAVSYPVKSRMEQGTKDNVQTKAKEEPSPAIPMGGSSEVGPSPVEPSDTQVHLSC